MQRTILLNRVKFWCYTINNYDENSSIKKLEDKCTYYVEAKEVGEKGTPHLQGFVCFKKQMRFETLRRLLPGAHLENKSKNSTFKQASEYCKKPGNEYIEFGELPLERGQAGGRAKAASDYAKAAALAEAQNLTDDIDSEIRVKYYGNLSRIAQDNPPAVDDLSGPCGYWYVGEPGTGKSTAARTRYPGAFRKNANKWWDGYKGQETLILDDFSMCHACLGYHLKIWADSGAFVAEIKGSSRYYRPKNLIVTSNYTIEEIWESDPIMRDAILDRFIVEYFNTRYRKNKRGTARGYVNRPTGAIGPGAEQ